MNQTLHTEDELLKRLEELKRANEQRKRMCEIARLEQIVSEEEIFSEIDKEEKRVRTIKFDFANNFKRIQRKTITSMLIVCCICLLFSYCIYACGIIMKEEDVSKEEVTGNQEIVSEKVILEEPVIEEIIQEPQVVTTTEMIGIKEKTYKANSGDSYTIVAILNIPSLGIEYPVLSKTSDELMEISLNKFWGAEPNEVGNCCIVGHNYLNQTHFGKLPQIKKGDEVEITDAKGRTLTYVVYDTYIVNPEDTKCTSQLTDGRREITLITCENGGATRFIAKAAAIEK